MDNVILFLDIYVVRLVSFELNMSAGLIRLKPPLCELNYLIIV
jgi:hypothetical protein